MRIGISTSIARLLLLVLLALAFTPASIAQAMVINVDSETQKNSIGVLMEFLEDPTGKLTLTDIMRPENQAKFVPRNQDVPNFGLTNSAIWLRANVESSSKLPVNKYLEIGYPLLDHVAFFLVQGSKTIDHFSGGDTVSFGSRPISFRTFIIPLRFEPGSRSTMYIRVQSESSLQIPLTFWSRDAFSASATSEEYLLGLYYGIMLVMVLYNLFVYLSVRDKSYLYYVLFIASYAVFQMAWNGLAFEILWPDSPTLGNLALIFFLGLLTLFSALFCIEFLATRKTNPRLHYLLVTQAILGAVLLVASPFAPYGTAIRFGMLSSILIPVAILSNGFYALKKGNRAARYFVAAWLVFMLGVFVAVLRTVGLLPTTFLTEWSVQIGSAIEVILLSLAVADKINGLRDEARVAHEKLMTSQKLAIENLRQADKLKDEFLANTSHELRTPIMGIMGISESILAGAAGALNEQLRTQLLLIAQSGRRLTGLISEILDFSKLKEQRFELQLEPVDLVSSIELVVSTSIHLLGKKDVVITSTVPKNLPAVKADPDRLQQILYNLIGNATKFTERGRIVISATEIENVVQVCVSDTGIGIAESARGKIFQAFEQGDASTTRKYGGTGLGLSVTKKLVELHGGRIWFESERGKGSHFFFSLPTTTESPGALLDTMAHQYMSDIELGVEEGSPPRNEPSPAAVTGVVLVVDDEPVNRHVIHNQLALRSFKSVEVASGQEALRYLANNPLPDLVLLDVMMPEMSGYETCREIRKGHSIDELPIVFITAKNQISNLVEGFGAGCNDYLAKPFLLNELLARVETQMKLARTSRAVHRSQLHTQTVLKATQAMMTASEETTLFGCFASALTSAFGVNPEATCQCTAFVRREYARTSTNHWCFSLQKEPANSEIKMRAMSHFIQNIEIETLDEEPVAHFAQTWTRSSDSLFVPLKRGSEPIGALELEFMVTQEHFPEDDFLVAALCQSLVLSLDALKRNASILPCSLKGALR